MSHDTLAQQVEELRHQVEYLTEAHATAQTRISLLELMQEVARSLVSDQSLEQLLRRILKSAVRVASANAGALLLLNRATNELVFAVTEGGAGQSLEKTRMPADKGIAGWVATHGEPLSVDDVQQDERYYPRIAQDHDFTTRSILCVPMIVRGNVIGVFQVLNRVSGTRFTPGDQELLSAFSAQSAVVIENARLYQNLRDERDRIVAIEEEVRHRLARDIHDGPAQMLAALIMATAFVRDALTHERLDLAMHELEEMVPVADKALRQLRTLLFDLRPVILETKGLIPALESYAKMLQQNERFSVGLDVRGDVPRLTHSAEAVIFQVVQEAFSNVRKHADASQVTVVVTPEKSGQLAVSVRDNGAGFETDQVDRVREEKGSLGMLNMRERARTVNGTLSIASKPGHGTTVTLRVPIATNLARNTNPESDATQPLVPG